MTNEELWLTTQLGRILGTDLIDILPRTGPGDDILLSTDRNPNTVGAQLLGVSAYPGARLPGIVDAIRAGHIKALVALGEDPIDLGLTEAELKTLPVLVVMNILENKTTHIATAVLPAFGFAEKRGSMVNGKGRLQRLNRAVRGPGKARDDWEILRDLIDACAVSAFTTTSNGATTLPLIEDVFRQMAAVIPQFTGLTLSKISDLGVQVIGGTNGTT